MLQKIRLTPLLSIFLWAVSAVPAVAITSTPSWKPRETVSLLADYEPLNGADQMLAYDHHGNPGIAFIGQGDGSLDYARRVPGLGWVSAELDPNLSEHPSLAYDRYERPAISYGSIANGVGFAHFDGANWQLETVDPAGGRFTSLAFDVLGRPAIAYTSDITSALKYVLDTDGDFSFTNETPVTVANGFFDGYFPTLAFDPLNRPMVVHSDISAQEILFSVEEPGIGWVTTTVATGAINPGSLAIDPDTGFPAIAVGGGASGLQFFGWNGTVWNPKIVDSTANVGAHVSLAFDPADGQPAISYNNIASSELNFAWLKGSDWQIQNVDSQIEDFRQSSLAFNDFGNGFASIAYVDEGGDLFFIEDPPLAVPEPASALLMLLGLSSFLARRRQPTV